MIWTLRLSLAAAASMSWFRGLHESAEAVTAMQYSDDHLEFSRQVQGLGFSKRVYTTISLKTQQPCRVTVTEYLPQEWFVDVDEVSSALNFTHDSLIDIEKPTSLSKDSLYSFDLKGPSIEFDYPIHMRYNDCSADVLYRPARLVGPALSFSCMPGEVKVPQAVQFMMPVGNLNETSAVQRLTTVAVMIATCLLLYMIHSTAQRLEQKQKL